MSNGDTMTADEYQALMKDAPSKGKRAHKYGAQPTTYNGVRYASKTEAKRAGQLDLLLRAGEIVAWARQPTFRLGLPEIICRWDFLVFTTANEFYCEDVKGFKTDEFKRNAALWKKYGVCDLLILRRVRSGWLTESIVPEVTP